MYTRKGLDNQDKLPLNHKDYLKFFLKYGISMLLLIFLSCIIRTNPIREANSMLKMTINSNSKEVSL